MFFKRKYRYNILKNVRVDISDMKVYRKFLQIRRGKIHGVCWKLVDYKTTHELHNGEARACPPEEMKRLLKTAF
jgi:hypothetical protein